MDNSDLTLILLSTLEFLVSLVATICHTPCAKRHAPCAKRHALCSMRYARITRIAVLSPGWLSLF
jgi:hypothetical protein